MVRGWTAVVGLLVLLLSACSSDAVLSATDDESAVPTPQFEPTATAVVAEPTPVEPTAVPPATATVEAPTPAAQTIDDPGWLRVNGLGDNDFGTDQATVLASIEAVFGAPQSLGAANECGAGPMTIASFDDFTVQFQDGVLIGWYYASSNPPLTTPSGVMPGLTEAQLEQVYQGMTVRDDSLGREFFFEVPAGFMGGFIDSTGGSVTALYAGTNCFFR